MPTVSNKGLLVTFLLACKFFRARPGADEKSRLLKTSKLILEPGQSIKIPIKLRFDKVPPKDIIVRVQGNLIPLVAGKRIPVGNGYTFQVKAKK